MGSMELEPCAGLFYPQSPDLPVIRTRDLARRGIEDDPDQVERMTGADHRSKGFFAIRPVWTAGGKRAEPAAFGEAKRRGERIFSRLFAHLLGFDGLDAGRSERLGDPTLAISATLQRRGARGGERGIVDVAEAGKPLDQCLDLRRLHTAPAPFANFAPEIEAQFRARRGIAADIEEGETLERLLVQRPRRSPPLLWCHAP